MPLSTKPSSSVITISNHQRGGLGCVDGEVHSQAKGRTQAPRQILRRQTGLQQRQVSEILRRGRRSLRSLTKLLAQGLTTCENAKVARSCKADAASGQPQRESRPPFAPLTNQVARPGAHNLRKRRGSSQLRSRRGLRPSAARIEAAVRSAH